MERYSEGKERGLRDRRRRRDEDLAGGERKWGSG